LKCNQGHWHPRPGAPGEGQRCWSVGWGAEAPAAAQACEQQCPELASHAVRGVFMGTADFAAYKVVLGLSGGF